MSGAHDDYVTRLPHPRLRPFVSSYTGYRMSGMEPGTHAGLPSGTLTMIISFDDKLDVEDGHQPGRRDLFWSMIGGLHSRPATVHHTGRQHGVQLEITPRGAHALFGVPAASLAKECEHLDDVSPSFAAELVDRVSAASTWDARWRVLDEVFLRVVSFDRPMPVELERAWCLLAASHGTTPVGELAQHAGWSRRHFTKKFSQHYGLSPKVMARVLRFERAQKMLRLPTRPSLGSIAAACGYADQAHMTRDWVEFAGSAPTIWLGDPVLPDPAGQDPDPSVQDRSD